jgi:23S rRNA (pseudouridine1915-N3)-methyltransferase
VKVRLISVGRARDDALADRVAELGDRIRRFGMDWKIVEVREERAGGRYSDTHVREREADAVRAALSGQGTVIAVDPGGKMFSSEKLARSIERWVRPEASFVVGGPLGLHESFTADADVVWSLSPLTFPHELARLIVAEQIYRALTIARNVPYHKR